MSTNAPVPASGAPVARVVDAKNPRTQDEDTERIFQWIGRSREASNEEMIAYMKLKFTFTTKDGHGWYWYRKPWHPIDARVDSRNPRSLAEDHNQLYQWSCTAPSVSDDWNYCGPDGEGVRWYRRKWPVKDPSNPLRPSDDTELRYRWSVADRTNSADNMALVRDGWEFASKSLGCGANIWRKRRRVEGVLPPEAEEPETERDEDAARRVAARRVGGANPNPNGVDMRDFVVDASLSVPMREVAAGDPESSRTLAARRVVEAEGARQRASAAHDAEGVLAAEGIRRDAMQELAVIRQRRLNESVLRERARVERAMRRGRALADTSHDVQPVQPLEEDDPDGNTDAPDVHGA